MPDETRAVTSWILRQLQDPMRLRRWVEFLVALWIRFMELALVTGAALYVVLGAFRFGAATEWTLTGLLSAVDEHWKGSLLLTGLLFLRPLQELLGRTSELSLPWAKIPFAPEKPEVLEPKAKP